MKMSYPKVLVAMIISHTEVGILKVSLEFVVESLLIFGYLNMNANIPGTIPFLIFGYI